MSPTKIHEFVFGLTMLLVSIIGGLTIYFQSLFIMGYGLLAMFALLGCIIMWDTLKERN